MATLKQLIRQGDPGKVARFLDKLSPEQRVSQCMALSGKDQARLWEMVGRKRSSFDATFFVPAAAKKLVPFPFEGKNSLPAFSRFQKVFYRTKEGYVAGYNYQTLMKITGPGYYILEKASDQDPGPMVINYLKVPESKPSSWPKIQSNDAFPSRFIYGGMMDYLRKVSKDVVIGRAFKQGKPMPNYFVLCRPGR